MAAYRQAFNQRFDQMMDLLSRPASGNQVANQPKKFDNKDLFMAIGTASFDVQLQQALKRLETNRIADRIRFNESMASLGISSPLKEVTGTDSCAEIHDLSGMLTPPPLSSPSNLQYIHGGGSFYGNETVHGNHFQDPIIENDPSAIVANVSDFNCDEKLEIPFEVFNKETAHKVFDQSPEPVDHSFHTDYDDSDEDESAPNLECPVVEDVIPAGALEEVIVNHSSFIIENASGQHNNKNDAAIVGVFNFENVAVVPTEFCINPGLEIGYAHMSSLGVILPIEVSNWPLPSNVSSHGRLQVIDGSLAGYFDMEPFEASFEVSFVGLAQDSGRAVMAHKKALLFMVMEFTQGSSQFMVFDRGKFVCLMDWDWWCLVLVVCCFCGVVLLILLFIVSFYWVVLFFL